ncbi:MAG: hypothetical protein JWN78_3244 [Bacteroidota bacterium]|nr:hypothetical protein [Bacteroidota bacterium]
MVTSKVEYLGELRTRATHIKSGEQIITDAPPDNQGKGEAFSPTDLAATSLATCMITIMGIKAKSMDLELKSISAEVTKVMYSEPRRIGEIHINMSVEDNGYSEKEKQSLIQAAFACPVAKSLHPDLKQVVEIKFA